MTDVVLKKKKSIERCIRQIRICYEQPSNLPFEEDYYKKEALVPKIMEAVAHVIDMANDVIKIRKLALPKESRESFEILAKAQVIPAELAGKMKGMVGLCHSLVFEHLHLDMAILVDVIEHRLDDLILFSNYVMTYLGDNPA